MDLHGDYNGHEFRHLPEESVEVIGVETSSQLELAQREAEAQARQILDAGGYIVRLVVKDEISGSPGLAAYMKAIITRARPRKITQTQ